MSEKVVIPKRFNGPPDSANGGYTCGIVAGLLAGPAEVTLRMPPPLERPLEVVRSGSGALELRDGDALVAEGVRVDLELAVPDPVEPDAAAIAARSYAGFEHHAYSTCFTCGPKRSDGLSIFPGPVAGRDLVAAPWLPPSGDVAPEIAWAALDCPSGWAVDDFKREGILLGRLAARLLAPIKGGERHVVLGWPLGIDGRKRYAGSAIFSGSGELCALARSTWIEVRAS